MNFGSNFLTSSEHKSHFEPMADCVARCYTALASVHTDQQALTWTKKQDKQRGRNTSLHISCATQSGGSGGTRSISGKKVKVLQVGDSAANLRDKVIGEPAAVKLLTRVQQLRLLTKAEKAGLLSAAERAGLSLSTIEKLGLLSKAEELGILSAATDPRTPGSLLSLAFILLLAAPAFVYFVPEDALWEVVLQIIVAFATVIGGSAAFAASKFVSALQKSD